MKEWTIILATGNQGKVGEFADILACSSISIVALGSIWNPLPVIPETGATFEENALQKALWVHARLGGWVLADDSGLQVDALGGRPGIFSARFAGENAGDVANRKKLLADMAAVAPESRTARFRCVIALVEPSGKTQTFSGACEGSILSQEQGTGGFGYDSLFVPHTDSQTFAQMPAARKHAISHRGVALLGLRDYVANRT